MHTADCYNNSSAASSYRIKPNYHGYAKRTSHGEDSQPTLEDVVVNTQELMGHGRDTVSFSNPETGGNK